MRTLLVLTTALISVGSLALGRPLPTREPDPGYYGLDANQQFMCNYGGFNIRFSGMGMSGSSPHTYHWNRAAVPVIGKGETVSKIEVADQLTHRTTSSEYAGFSVAIYSSSKNEPFKELVGASATGSGCGITVSIPSIQLEKGKKYWVVEQLHSVCLCGSGQELLALEWFYATTKNYKSYKSLFQSGYSYCELSPINGCSQYDITPWLRLPHRLCVKPISNALARRENVLAQFQSDHGSLQSGDTVQFRLQAMRVRDPP